jgi:hypothetical protein
MTFPKYVKVTYPLKNWSYTFNDLEEFQTWVIEWAADLTRTEDLEFATGFMNSIMQVVDNNSERFYTGDYIFDFTKPKTYWETQFETRIGSNNANHGVKFFATNGMTNTLSLTPKQFEQIKGFMLSIEEELI